MILFIINRYANLYKLSDIILYILFLFNFIKIFSILIFKSIVSNI